MKNPQTLAEELYKQFPTLKLKSIMQYACCAFTFLWCMGIEDDDAQAIITVGKMIDAGVIDADCTVYWDKMAKFISGRNCAVDKVEITSIAKIKDRTPVRYDYSGKSHWVGVEKGKIVFNSLKSSNCVAKGKPTQARILHFSGGTK